MRAAWIAVGAATIGAAAWGGCGQDGGELFTTSIGSTSTSSSSSSSSSSGASSSSGSGGALPDAGPGGSGQGGTAGAGAGGEMPDGGADGDAREGDAAPLVSDAGAICSAQPVFDQNCAAMYPDAGPLYGWHCGDADSGPTAPDPSLGCFLLGAEVLWCCP